MAWNPFGRKLKTPQGTTEDLYPIFRQKWLGGEMAAAAPSGYGPTDVIGVLMELNMRLGAATLVGAEDGTASLYTSPGGGVIGMGYHAPTAAASLALVGCARSFLEFFSKTTNFPLPRPGTVAFRIVTRGGVHSAEFAEAEARDNSPVTPLYVAAHHLLTNARLLDARRREGGIGPHVVHAHVFPDGGVCVLVPPNAPATWLTVWQLKRVLEIARGHDDRLEVDVEPGDSRQQAPALAALGQSGLMGAPTPAPRLLTYTGGTTTLLSAVEDARLDVIEELVQRGANLEVHDARGYTGLILAAFKGRRPLLRLLLQAGSDVNARDRHGNSALLFAAQYGDLVAVKLLEAAGADPNIRGQNGYTALKVANLCSHPEVANFLVNHGAME